jgi:hypothetical protein
MADTRREQWRDPRAQSMPRRDGTSERMASRTAAPSEWHDRAVRGPAQHEVWEDYRARSWVAEHRPWNVRGGYQGYRIPVDRYRVAFGPTHRFRVDRCPVVLVSGYPRFYYSGYWVTFIDPWPEYWADDWYERDDCYVVYADDGYYLRNVRYPGVRIAVSFRLG